MEEEEQMEDDVTKSVKSIFLWTRLLDLPFWGASSLLTFILCKDLHINAFQVALIIAVKPISSLLAPYWSQTIHQRSDRIISNLAWANILRYFLFLFIPWVDSIWYITLAFGVYMMLYRASIPAWIEVFKCHLSKPVQGRLVSYKSIIDYGGAALITFALGLFLDHFEYVWRWVFFWTAAFGMSATWLLLRLPVPKVSAHQKAESIEAGKNFCLRELLLKPWSDAWSLIRTFPDFMHYHIGFMLGGAGIMIVQPALPPFFIDTLHLSYAELSVALTVCKAIGVALTSPLWAKLFPKLDIYYFSCLAIFLAALFPCFLWLAPLHLSLLYIAYLLYGVMQGGSELSWHMSALTFSKEKESSPFSSTNLLTVGIRGCVIPALGALLLVAAGPTGVMIASGSLCLAATWYLMRCSLAVRPILAKTGHSKSNKTA